MCFTCFSCLNLSFVFVFSFASGARSAKRACLERLADIEKEGYLRLRNSFPPSPYSPVTYSKPVSMSWHAWVAFWATLLVHSSVPVRNIADSMLMYTIVETMLLCPSMIFTWIMSLVLWYSIVAFQCLNV